MLLLCGSRLSFCQDITIKSHFNSTIQEDNTQGKYTKAVDNSAPPGLNDKYHGTSNHNATKNSDSSQSHFWLVPPFIIGASVAIVVYIICNCFYIHCYAHKKIKKMAEKHFSSPILLTEEGSSSGSYQAFTPIITYNEGQEEPGHFLFYQPYNDNEWEFSVDESSNRSSIRGSINSKSSFKKSILPKRLFSKKQQPSTSTSSAPEELQPAGRKKASICLVLFNRSQSVPDKELGTKRMIYAPMMLPRVQSLKLLHHPKNIVSRALTVMGMCYLRLHFLSLVKEKALVKLSSARPLCHLISRAHLSLLEKQRMKYLTLLRNLRNRRTLL